jgi:hypothetical protein
LGSPVGRSSPGRGQRPGVAHGGSAPDPDDRVGDRVVSPYRRFAVSWHLESSEDVVSPSGNDFYNFFSLSSFIGRHVTIFAYVAPHLLEIETIINVPLGLPS